jgi:hypothetical protein
VASDRRVLVASALRVAWTQRRDPCRFAPRRGHCSARSPGRPFVRRNPAADRDQIRQNGDGICHKTLSLLGYRLTVEQFHIWRNPCFKPLGRNTVAADLGTGVEIPSRSATGTLRAKRRPMTYGNSERYSQGRALCPLKEMLIKEPCHCERSAAIQAELARSVAYGSPRRVAPRDDDLAQRLPNGVSHGRVRNSHV